MLINVVKHPKIFVLIEQPKIFKKILKCEVQLLHRKVFAAAPILASIRHWIFLIPNFVYQFSYCLRIRP